jgi:hypothetical protein
MQRKENIRNCHSIMNMGQDEYFFRTTIYYPCSLCATTLAYRSLRACITATGLNYWTLTVQFTWHSGLPRLYNKAPLFSS